jgi:hypothetical protein
LSYRLGGIPPETSVVVRLSFRTGNGSWLGVDSARLVTAPANQDTEAPVLRLLDGVGPTDPGIQLVGQVEAGGAYAPGADPPPIPARSGFDVSVVDAQGGLLSKTPVSSGPRARDRLPYQLTNLLPCAQCTLQLRDSHNVLRDSVPLALPDQSPIVVPAPRLATDAAASGPFLAGSMSAAHAFSSADVVIRVADTSGHVLARSTDRGVSRNCGSPPAACGRDRNAAFRLGHMPLSGKVIVAAVDSRTKRVLASTRVALAGNGADTDVGDLKLPDRFRR